MTPPAGECDCTLFVEYLQDMIDGFRALSQDEEKVFISSTIIFSLMFAEYIQAAMEKATYEIIDDPEPFYGEVPEGHIIQVSKEPMAVAD